MNSDMLIKVAVVVIAVGVVYLVVMKTARANRIRRIRDRVIRNVRAARRVANDIGTVKGPCDYMSDQGYSTNFVGDCQAYAAKCGMGSTVTEVLSLSASYSPSSDADTAIANDLASVQQSINNCAQLQTCQTDDDCATQFGLSCKSGQCTM